MSDDKIICGQTVRIGDDCCASFDGRCAGTATWERAEDGVALCDMHLGNAKMLGGAKLGYWVVGETKVPYPDGWTRIEDGEPLVDEAPVQVKASPAAESEKVRPSGLVLP